MKAYSLLPDTYIIADPCGRVMDKVRIFYEGTVNVHVRAFSHKGKPPPAGRPEGVCLKREKREGGF